MRVIVSYIRMSNTGGRYDFFLYSNPFLHFTCSLACIAATLWPHSKTDLIIGGISLVMPVLPDECWHARSIGHSSRNLGLNWHLRALSRTDAGQTMSWPDVRKEEDSSAKMEPSHTFLYKDKGWKIKINVQVTWSVIGRQFMVWLVLLFH